MDFNKHTEADEAMLLTLTASSMDCGRLMYCFFILATSMLTSW